MFRHAADEDRPLNDRLLRNRPSHGGGILPSSLAPGLFLAVAILAAYAWWGRTTQPSIDTRAASAWASFGAVVVFAAFAFRARRWLAFPVAAWGVLALGIAHATTTLRPVRLFYSAEVEGRVEQAENRLSELDFEAKDVAVWQAGGSPSRTVPCRSWETGAVFVPGLPIPIPTTHSTYGVAYFAGPARAIRPSWARFGEGWARVLPERRNQVEAELAAYQAGLAEPPRSAFEEARLWAIESIGLTVVLVGFNGLALLASGLLRRWPRRVRTVGAG